MSSAAVASAMASRKVVSAVPASNSPGASVCCSWRKASRTVGQRACARGVGSTPAPERRTNSSPSSSRRRRSELLTAGWVIARLRAARVRLRSAITSSKTRSRLRSNVRKLTSISGMNDKHQKDKVAEHWGNP
ncbi:hypothetical protein FQZ97_1128860 [compost metagenome]